MKEITSFVREQELENLKTLDPYHKTKQARGKLPHFLNPCHAE